MENNEFIEVCIKICTSHYFDDITKLENINW